MRLALALCLAGMIISCGRSKDPQYYVLNPLYTKPTFTRQPANLLIGIDKIDTPDYLDRPQLVIFCNKHQSRLDENHHWAESINNNVKRVIKTNLTNLLAGAIVEVAPWDNSFTPDYHLSIFISEFKVDVHGNSDLYAEYTIGNGQSLHRYQKHYYQKISPVTPNALAASMNYNLNQLTQDIAKSWVK